jgi:uncharacterized membrane protein YvbJ
MFCPQCGTDNPNGARFCGSCGASLPHAARPAQPGDPQHEGVSQGLKIGVAVASLIIPLIGIILGIIYMLDSNPQKNAAGRLWLLVGGGVVVFYCFLMRI